MPSSLMADKQNLCMRAVNQSIGECQHDLHYWHTASIREAEQEGRAIRHANDYACILLLDKRYATARIRNKLPKWIGEDVQVPADYGGVARGVAAFFKEKRERAVQAVS